VQMLLVIVAVLQCATLIALIVGVALYLRRLNCATDELAQTLKVAREGILPLVEDARHTLGNMDALIISARKEVETVGRITESVERLIEGRTITETAGKVVASSRSTLVSVFEGLKEGLRALRRAKRESEEESHDE
jgi:hypothetical protein